MDFYDCLRDGDCERRDTMMTAIVMLTGIAIFVGIITAMDLWTQRQDRLNGRARTDRP